MIGTYDNDHMMTGDVYISTLCLIIKDMSFISIHLRILMTGIHIHTSHCCINLCTYLVVPVAGTSPDRDSSEGSEWSIAVRHRRLSSRLTVISFNHISLEPSSTIKI